MDADLLVKASYSHTTLHRRSYSFCRRFSRSKQQYTISEQEEHFETAQNAHTDRNCSDVKDCALGLNNIGYRQFSTPITNITRNLVDYQPESLDTM